MKTFMGLIKRFINESAAEGDLNSLAVVLNDVTATHKQARKSNKIPTVVNALNPLALRSHGFDTITDLANVNAVIEPGQMCLVLGKPGSGASEFIQLISGHNIDQFSEIEGKFQFNGMDYKDVMEQSKQSLVYSSEDDNHYPFLTVQQTVKFAVSCKTPKSIGSNRDKFIEETTDALIQLFGLGHAKNTFIGNDYVKGISGGEKKRVSLIECLATRAPILCFDNSTKGLDSSTALQYISSVRTLTDITHATTIININQASENIYGYFDKVCIFHDHKQVYFGPPEMAKLYFEDLGFLKDENVTTPDFLASIVERSEPPVQPGFERVVPRSSEDFHNKWVKSTLYQDCISQVATSQQKYANTDTTITPRSNFSLGFLAQLQLCCTRGFQNTVGSKAFAVSQLISAIIQSLVIGSLFYEIPQTTIGSYSRGSLMFFALLYFAFIALTEIMKSFQFKLIINKQREFFFYRPSAHALSEIISDIPLKLVLVIVFSLILYFLAHLQYHAGKFFIFVLFLWLVAENLTSLFQAIAQITPTLSIANAVGGILLLAIAMYATYVIQLRTMHPWFKWIAYINPVFYAFEAMLSTELNLMLLDCSSTLIPSGPGYEHLTREFQICGWYGATLGNNFVRGELFLDSQYGYSYSHVWRNLGILIGFWVFFIAVTVVGSEVFHFNGKAIHKTYSKAKSAAKIECDDIEHVREHGKLEIFDETDESSDVITDFKTTGTFVWRDVDYVIPTKTGERKLLNKISGYIKPGTLTALMGASGAGKTTLLNALSDRADVGIVTGDILVDGKHDNEAISKRTGFVQQQDLHVAEYTVRESLIFSARLRRSYDIPDQEKLDYVEKVISMLNMSSYADSMIGDFTKGNGLNPAQMKKISIAVELVTRPSLLLFLDEPTSGFDSEEAISIIKLLRDLADAGQAILCTIHQPSASLISEFDSLLLLQRGGDTVYFGDLKNCDGSYAVLDYFHHNGAPQCAPSENPAEYILEQTLKGDIDWASVWERSKENQMLHEEITRLVAASNGQPPREFHFRTIPYHYQLQLVLRRTFTLFYRDPIYIFAKFLLNIVGGLFIGFTFWDIGNNLTSLQNSIFVVFMVLVISSPLIHQIQDRASRARDIYDAREAKSRTFHWSIMILSQFLAELPYTMFASTIAFFCFYFCLKRDNSAPFAGVFFLTYCIIFQMYYISFGLWIFYAASNLIVSAVLVAFLFSFTVSFCGVMQPSGLMPRFWIFVYRVSPYTYLVELLTVLLIHDLPVQCEIMEAAIFRPDHTGISCGDYSLQFVADNGGYITHPESMFLCTYCNYANGDEFLADENMSYDHLWRDFGILCAFVGFNIFAMFFCYYMFSVKKVLRRFRIGKLW